MSATARVMTVYGTRPEAIKVAPVIAALEASAVVESVTVVTGQHREMLDQVNQIFGIVPDHDLDVFAHAQGLNTLMAKVFERLDPVLESVRPDALVVQGDTSTVAAASIAAFYRQIPVVHLEAGLRSHDITSPFPEEANRKLTTQVTALHLAPTPTSRDNLLGETVDPATIAVTGNTVIDALLHTVGQNLPVSDPRLAELVEQEAPVLAGTIRDNLLFVREREWEAAHTIWVWPDCSPSMLFTSSKNVPPKPCAQTRSPLGSSF